MTVWCDSCRSCHVSSRCAPLHLREEDPRRATYRRFRSTKGASKARRDHINHEIRNMRALLPIGPEDQERLSYLHSMAAICTYIRKSVLFQGLQAVDRSDSCLPYEAFLEALHGFILVCTAQGRLVYVSENVAEYLGLSMVDVLQGDTLYDLVDHSDQDVVRTNLDVKNNSSADRSFVCCMQTSKSFKLRHGSCCSMLVRGSFQFFPQSFSAASRTTEPVFVALCTPTANRLASSSSRVCQSFSSEHRADMSFTQSSESVFFLLGYSAEEMSGRSWYSLVHPADLALAADSHRSLVQADEGFQVEMVLRLQTTDLSWTWVYIQAENTREQQSISCTNFIISEAEARFLQKKTSSEAFRPPPGSNYQHFAQQAPQSWTDNPKGCKRLRRCNSQSEDPGVVLCSSSQSAGSPAPFDLFTPPYSPSSSSSPPQQEELLSSPGSSPSYYSHPAAGLTCHPSPADSAPRTAEPAFDPPPTSMSPPPSLPLDYDFPPCPSDARSVPDCLFVSDVFELPAESSSLHPEDFDLLDPPQGGGPVQLQHVPQQELPGLLTPLQSPGSTSLYSEQEQEEISILAQQISSLANSFDLHRSLDLFQISARDWNHQPEPLGGHASMFQSIQSPGKTALSCPGLHPYQGQETLDLFQEDPLPEQQFCPGGITVDPFSLRLGHQNLNTGLHQLNFCLSRLHPDGLTEQTLY